MQTTPSEHLEAGRIESLVRVHVAQVDSHALRALAAQLLQAVHHLIGQRVFRAEGLGVTRHPARLFTSLGSH